MEEPKKSGEGISSEEGGDGSGLTIGSLREDACPVKGGVAALSDEVCKRLESCTTRACWILPQPGEGGVKGSNEGVPGSHLLKALQVSSLSAHSSKIA